MKKRKTRFLKRLFILVLCLCLVSGTVINKNKISAHAAGLTLTLGSYTAYEICLYVGTLLIGSLGIGVAIDNRDEIAEMGKNFIDSMELDDLKEWLLTKVTSDGQSYVFGSEALKEVQNMEFSVIQGGGNMPENNQDNDNDGDIDAEDRTEELKNLGLWATSSFADLICDQLQPLLEDVNAGNETFLDESLGINNNFYGYNKCGDYYIYDGYFIASNKYTGEITQKQAIRSFDDDGNYFYDFPYAAYLYQDFGTWKKYRFCCFVNGNIYADRTLRGCDVPADGTIGFNGKVLEFAVGFNSSYNMLYKCTYQVPMYSSLEEASIALRSGVHSGALNFNGTYRIADWIQEDWAGVLENLNMGIRSLNGNLLIVGEALKQALQNQLNGLGYIGAVDTGINGADPLVLPDAIKDPIYYPADLGVPKLDDDKLPWNNPEGVPGTSPGGDDPNPPDSDEGITDEDNLDPKDSFGLNTLFGILIVLIEILITLLIIFLSCLVFITTIFRIPPQQGFLPDEMVMSLEYLKTLIIPGLGISVWSFFMALIYIILIFTVIGILRKNIDKIRFPRRRI